MPTTIEALGAPLSFPSGATMPNRFAKAPMEEVLSTFLGGPPNEQLNNLYRRWAAAGWGMIITGNVNIDERFLGLPFDVVIPPASEPKRRRRYLDEFRKYADACKGAPDDRRPLAIVQMVHTGRQSMRGNGRAPWTPSIAPSPLQLSASQYKALNATLFGTPREMTKDDIADVVARFASGAVFCYQAGFDGIELHAAHGYLLSTLSLIHI